MVEKTPRREKSKRLARTSEGGQHRAGRRKFLFTAAEEVPAKSPPSLKPKRSSTSSQQPKRQKNSPPETLKQQSESQRTGKRFSFKFDVSAGVPEPPSLNSPEHESSSEASPPLPSPSPPSSPPVSEMPSRGPSLRTPTPLKQKRTSPSPSLKQSRDTSPVREAPMAHKPKTKKPALKTQRLTARVKGSGGMSPKPASPTTHLLEDRQQLKVKHNTMLIYSVELVLKEIDEMKAEAASRGFNMPEFSKLKRALHEELRPYIEAEQEFIELRKQKRNQDKETKKLRAELQAVNKEIQQLEREQADLGETQREEAATDQSLKAVSSFLKEVEGLFQHELPKDSSATIDMNSANLGAALAVLESSGEHLSTVRETNVRLRAALAKLEEL